MLQATHDLPHLGKLRTAATVTKRDEMLALFEDNPQTSAHCLATQTRISPQSVSDTTYEV